MGFAPAQGSGGEGPTHLMPEQPGDPTAVLDAGTVYTKDVAGATELFYEDSAGNDVQITDAGAVVGPTPGGSGDDIQINNGSGGFGARLSINSSNQLLVANDGTGFGSIGTPSISPSSDLTTGISFGNSGTAGPVKIISDGALRMQIGATHTQIMNSNQLRVPFGSTGAPGIEFGSAQVGITGSGNNFRSVTKGIEAGFRVSQINSSPVQGAIHFQDHEASPLVACSLSGGYKTSMYDFDTGFTFHVGGTDNECSVFTAGVERVKYRSDGSIEQSPALANSTGVVTDTAAVQTTDATQTSAWSRTLADNTTYCVTVTVVGRDTAGTERCSYVRRVQAHRQGAGVATISAINAPYSEETSAGLDATFTVNSNDLRVSVTGKAATTINWTVSITLMGSE